MKGSISSLEDEKKKDAFQNPEWIPTGDLKSILIGNYDYWHLLKPRWPFCSEGSPETRAVPFFSVNEGVPILLAIIMGFQHAAAMVGGIVSSPLIVAGYGSPNTDQGITEYLVAATLICSGISSALHSIRFRIPFTKSCFYGTGMISVTGISTTQVVVGLQSMRNYMAKGHSFREAYGSLLGTLAVCSFATTFISLLPARALNRIFPNWIAGQTTFLVGVLLVGVGFQQWGGGYGCTGFECSGSVCTGTDQLPSCCTTLKVCYGQNGSVNLPYGSRQYIGLGAISFAVLIFLELFGSPFMRNCEIIIALFFAYFVAALVRDDGKMFINPAAIQNAKSITFLWVETFPLGIFPEAILPFVIGFLADAANAAGDITATEEASLLETSGPRHEERLQGGLFADGINSCLAALATSLPVTVYAQNNGVISFTMCSSRVVGVVCGVWLVVFGILNKIAAVFAYAPTCVIGGILTFLFGSITVSGIKVMMEGAVDRRKRFIMCVATSVGVGVTMVPAWANNALWDCTPGITKCGTNDGLRALRDSIIIVLGNGYCVGWLICVLLHNIIPEEVDLMEQYRERVIALGLSPGSAIPPMSDMDDPVRYRKSNGMKGRGSSEDLKHSSEGEGPVCRPADIC